MPDTLSKPSIELIKTFREISKEIVTNCYPVIGESIYGLLMAAAALYIVWIVIRFYLMTGEPNINDMLIRLFRIGICLGIASSYEFFYNFFYSPLLDLFTALPEVVVKASFGGKLGDYDNILSILYTTVRKVNEAAHHSIANLSIFDLPVLLLNLFFSLTVGLIFMLLVICFVGINVLSILAASMIMMLAPFAIGLAAFDMTKQYASSMITSFIGYSIRPTFSAVGIAIVVFALNKIHIATLSVGGDFGMLLMLMTVGLIGIYLQIKVEEFASALTGGVASSSSGVMAMAGGAVAGFAVGRKMFGDDKSNKRGQSSSSSTPLPLNPSTNSNATPTTGNSSPSSNAEKRYSK
jgi:hypothetical protein